MRTSVKFTREEILESVTEDSSIALMFKIADLLGGEVPETFTATATSRTVTVHIPITYRVGDTGKWTQKNVFTMPSKNRAEASS